MVSSFTGVFTDSDLHMSELETGTRLDELMVENLMEMSGKDDFGGVFKPQQMLEDATC